MHKILSDTTLIMSERTIYLTCYHIVVSAVSISKSLLKFYKRIFNQSQNIPLQNKDAEVVSVQKMINLS